MPFAWGLFLGLLGGLVLTGAVSLIAYRRYERLQQRTRHAERLAELGTLTGGLAHEIKNPLSTVQLNLQLLREDIDPGWPGYSRLVSRMNIVQKETARLRDILDDFLRYAGKMELDRKPVDLNQVLEELVELHRVQLRVKKADGPLIASVDERMIKQAILNLMINALQAMPDTGGEIILSARREEDLVIIDVIDTGRGMAPDVAARIFDAYYSTKKSGTGLGLAITRRVVHEHGGKIELTSEEGKGSVFSIRLPSGT
jgi:signal transduction histidine kinase